MRLRKGKKDNEKRNYRYDNDTGAGGCVVVRTDGSGRGFQFEDGEHFVHEEHEQEIRCEEARQGHREDDQQDRCNCNEVTLVCDIGSVTSGSAIWAGPNGLPHSRSET